MLVRASCQLPKLPCQGVLLLCFFFNYYFLIDDPHFREAHQEDLKLALYYFTLKMASSLLKIHCREVGENSSILHKMIEKTALHNYRVYVIKIMGVKNISSLMAMLKFCTVFGRKYFLQSK